MPFPSYSIGANCTSGHALAVLDAAVSGSLPAGNSQLITDLGGDANVLAFYDARAGVTLNGSNVSQWDDCRGASGFGPSVAQPTAARQPAYNAGDESIDFAGGSTVNTLFDAADAFWDFSGVSRALVLIAGVGPPASDQYCMIVQDGAFARYLAILARGNANGNVFRGLKNGTACTTATAASATSTRRLIIATTNTTTGMSTQVVNGTKVTNTTTSIAAGNNLFCLGGHTDTGQGPPMVLRAALVLAIEPDTTQVSALGTYSTTYHGVTLV